MIIKEIQNVCENLVNQKLAYVTNRLQKCERWQGLCMEIVGAFEWDFPYVSHTHLTHLRSGTAVRSEKFHSNRISVSPDERQISYGHFKKMMESHYDMRQTSWKKIEKSIT